MPKLRWNDGMGVLPYTETCEEAGHMLVVLGKQKGKRALGKMKNVGCLKDPVEETVVLPVLIRIDGAGHQALLGPWGKKEDDQRGTVGLEGPGSILQSFECVLNLRCISTIVSRMFWCETLTLNWKCALIHFSCHPTVKKHYIYCQDITIYSVFS